MICSFTQKQDVIEVIALSLEQHEVTDNYIIKVMGLDADGNYTNRGHLELSEKEVEGLIASQYIENPKQLVGRKMAVVSNAICKKAGIQHLNTTVTPDEWQTLQQYIKKQNNPFADCDEDIEMEF